MPPKLPEYEPMLQAYHRAYAPSLQAMINLLPIAEGARVIDVACGDGAYSRWLAHKTGASGTVAAVDISPRYLELSRESIVASKAMGSIAFFQGDAQQLPFGDDTFDLAWCAQSLYSLPDVHAALYEMVRVVKPGGAVALLENDTLHHILLPWPIELELAVRLAEFRALAHQTDQPRKFYVGRRLVPLLTHIGLESVVEKTWATNRQSPLPEAERDFLSAYLSTLLDRITGHMAPDAEAVARALTTPGSPECLLDRPDLSVTCLDSVAWGLKPRPVGG